MKAGVLLGPYKIIDKIGSGGMGEVYRAADMRLGRDVAVKVLPSALLKDSDAIGRFERETKALAALSHPNIVSIFDVGSADGIHFAVTELLEGETLRRRIERPFQIKELAYIGVKIAEGLSAAHSKGIIHRDIKPDNIFLTKDGGVKILDFGIVKKAETLPSAGQSAAEQNQETRSGFIVGTPPYLSPEQLKKKNIDARSDLFSLGCVLYEMAAGKSPFLRSSDAEIIAAILREEPAGFDELGIDVVRELEEAIFGCLKKDQEERFQTAQEVASALKAVVLNGERTLSKLVNLRSGAAAKEDHHNPHNEIRESSEIKADESDPENRSQTTLKESSFGLKTGAFVSPPTERSASAGSKLIESSVRRVFYVGAVLLLTALLCYGIFSFYKPTLTRFDSIAVLPFENGSSDPNAEYLSDGITESIIEGLAHIPDLRVAANSRISVYKGRNVDPMKAGVELNVDAVLAGRVEQKGDELTVKTELVDASDGARLWSEQFTGNLSELPSFQSKMSEKLSLKLKGGLTVDQLRLMTKRSANNAEAHRLYLKGRYYWNKRTPEEVLKSVELFKSALALDPNYALAYSGLADAYSIQAFYGAGDSAEENYRKAKAAAEKALEIDENLAESHASLALAEIFLEQDFNGAEKEFKRAIELKPDYASAHQWYGTFLIQRSRYDEAIKELKLAQQLDPFSLIIASQLAMANYGLGRRDLAIEQLQMVLKTDPKYVPAHDLLGRLYLKSGKYNEAIAEFEAARSASIDATTYKAMIGWAYAMLGKKEDALKILNELNRPTERKSVSPYNLAFIYAALGEKSKAVSLFEEAFKSKPDLADLIKDDPRFGNIRSDPRFADLLKRYRIE